MPSRWFGAAVETTFVEYSNGVSPDMKLKGPALYTEVDLNEGEKKHANKNHPRGTWIGRFSESVEMAEDDEYENEPRHDLILTITTTRHTS